MCGLFGIMGQGIIREDMNALHSLGIISQLRGLDGFGCYQRPSYGNGWCAKSEEPLSTSWEELKYEHKKHKFLDSWSSSLYMCHVRAATKGSISQANAHPFVFGTTVLAHNGTLRDKRYQHKEKADSMLLAEDVDQRGIKNVLESLDPDSAFALSVWDNQRQKIYFARNSFRPLSFFFNEKRAVVYWASESKMLDFIVDRFKLEISHRVTFEVGKLYSTEISKIKPGENKIWQIEPLELRTRPKVVNIPGKKKEPQSSIIPRINTQKESKKKEKGKNQEGNQDVPNWVINSFYTDCTICGKPVNPSDYATTPTVDGGDVHHECWLEYVKKNSKAAN